MRKQYKIAIITVVGGDTATLKDPSIVHPNVDYIAFVGVKQDTVVWQQQHLFKFSSMPPDARKRDELLPRILPQIFCANHNYYILVDSNQTVVHDPFELVDKYLSDTALGLFAHRKYSCIWDAPWGTKSMSVLWQRDLYEKYGFPKQFGFYDLSFVLMRNSPMMLKMCLRWWEHICCFSALPELSLPYVLWTLGIKPTILPGYISKEATELGDSRIITMKREEIK